MVIDKVGEFVNTSTTEPLGLKIPNFNNPLPMPNNPPNNPEEDEIQMTRIDNRAFVEHSLNLKLIEKAKLIARVKAVMKDMVKWKAEVGALKEMLNDE